MRSILFLVCAIISGCSIVNAPEAVKTPSCGEIYQSPSQNLVNGNDHDVQLYNNVKDCVCSTMGCVNAELGIACTSNNIDQATVNDIAKQCPNLVAVCLPTIEACLNES